MLRALAVLLVLSHHTALRFRPHAEDPFGTLFLCAGWVGVDIFFVISGFLITRILLRADYDIHAFIRRRVFRIMPIFLVAVATFALLSMVTGTNADILHRMWSPALLLNGWTIPVYGYAAVPFTITWSLSVEEFAYVVLALAAVQGSTGLWRALAVFFIIAPLIRVVAVATGLIDPFDLYFFVLARLDSIALGGLAAFGLFDRLARLRHTAVLAGIGVAALVWMFQFVSISHSVMPLGGYLVFAVVTAVLVATFALPGADHPTPTISARLPTWIVDRLRALIVEFGQLSYFVYLFHMFVLEALRMVMPSLSFWSAITLTSATTFLLARLSWRWFEAPLIARGRRASWRAAFGSSLAAEAR